MFCFGIAGISFLGYFRLLCLMLPAKSGNITKEAGKQPVYLWMRITGIVLLLRILTIGKFQKKLIDYSQNRISCLQKQRNMPYGLQST